MKGGLTAVAFLEWGTDRIVVFRYYTPTGETLGAWNLTTDTTSFVSTLDTPTDQVQQRVFDVPLRRSWTS